jgi:hypothetical protein
VTGHLDLDGLADAVAGESEPSAAAHLASCATCRAALEEVRAADEQVSRRLAALPAPTVPDDVASRLIGTPPEVPAVTTLPAAAQLSSRWQPSRWQRLLPAAAAVVLLIAGGGYALTRLAGSGDTGGSASTSAGGAAKAAPTEGFPRSSSGTDYTGRADLARAVPDLLTGMTPPRAAAPMAGSANAAGALDRLRTTAGLADCLLALLPPEDPSVRPLALDYAAFRGRPALVVVLPGADADKVDVFVVGPGCSRANDSTLFYTSVPRA